MSKRTAKQPARKKAATRKKASTHRKTSTRAKPAHKKASTRKKTTARKKGSVRAKPARKKASTPNKTVTKWIGPAPAVCKPRKFKLSRGRICGCVAFQRRDRHNVDHYEMTIGTPTQPALARLNLTETERGWFVAQCDKMPLSVQQAALTYVKGLPRRKVTP